ncbi:MAG: Crp/Fnr family transcriptional regulator [Dehalococcoidia bacterium]|nr:Crp/Fnr family transcriptional regulator [Dehalococcoidia bacterium]
MTKLEFLQTSAIFADVPTLELEAISRRMFEKKLPRAEMVLSQGDETSTLFFVAEGVVKLFKTSIDGKEQVISLVRPGELFNVVPICDDGPTPMDAQALGAVTLYGITRDDLDLILRNYPKLARNISRLLAQRIRSLISLVEDLSFRSVTSRVARILLENLSEPSSLPAIRLTQREMAALAGTAREVVARSLKELESTGMIEIRLHQVAIRNKKGLEQIVEWGL